MHTMPSTPAYAAGPSRMLHVLDAALDQSHEAKVVPTAGLDAVLVAVERALQGTRRRRVSVEHVLNVLARLNAAPAPECAATALQVSTPPLANTERYDSLRTGNAANTPTEEADHA